MALSFNEKFAAPFVAPHEVEQIAGRVAHAHDVLHGGTGAGNGFLGWLTLPYDYDREEYERIKTAAKRIREDSDVLIVIGIGGSYLGARAAVEFIHSPLYNSLPKNTPEIMYAGNTLSGSALAELMTLCEGKRVSLNVISKSGTTTEPAIAFRVLRDWLERRYGAEEAARRIYCTTDRSKGTLRALATEKGYETFVIPDNIGGRYSVLTAVGLLPIAVSGADIDALLAGAREAAEAFRTPDLAKNDCYRYAAYRNLFYAKGYRLELMAAYEPRFAMMAEWFKQLFGESEGKDGKGLFPASVIYSTDLHSLGQYVQEGMRMLFQTVVNIGSAENEIVLREAEDNGDGLNFLAGKNLAEINEKAFLGTLLAHTDGGVPNLVLNVPAANERELGYMIYFFEKACAVSGYMLGVNPFDQPGVESYKKNMFALLGKPGFEAQRAELEARLNRN